MLTYKPKKAIHPGRTLQNNLEYYGLSQKWLAEHTGLSEKHISEIINGEAMITSETAVKLAHVFGGSPEFWTNLDANYRTAKALIAQEKLAEGELPYLEQIPYNEMAKAGWVEPTRNALERVINLYGFFGVSTLKSIPTTQVAAFRKAASRDVDEYAMAAWLRYGEKQALSRADIPDYDRDLLRNSLSRIKEIIYEFPRDFFQQITDVLAECGVVLVAVKYLPRTYVNGAARWVGRHPVIQLSDRGKNDDRVWFTLFHEIGHIILHGKKEQFLSLDNNEENRQELEADEFATEALLSSAVFDGFVTNTSVYTEELIREFSNRERVSPSIVVGRLEHFGYIKWGEFRQMHHKLHVID